MRDKPETLLRDQLAGNAADAIGLVLNTDKCSLEVLDELVLALCKRPCLFL